MDANSVNNGELLQVCGIFFFFFIFSLPSYCTLYILIFFSQFCLIYLQNASLNFIYLQTLADRAYFASEQIIH